MPQIPSAMHAICSQILSTDDLKMEQVLSEQIQLEKIVTRITFDDDHTVLRIYASKQLYLSEITPIVHDFGFIIIDEVTYMFEDQKQNIQVCRFNLKAPDIKKLARAQSNIESVITDALLGKIFSKCKIYSMVYLQNLSIRQVSLLRALIEYMNQAVLAINYETILHTLTTYDELSRLFLHYFVVKFDPKIVKRQHQLTEIETLIEESIKIVPNIMDDRILKLTYALLRTMTRTNYFLNEETIAFKIDMVLFSENLKGMQPRIESFVYHPDFSGLHLRMSRISRGGLRWSERHDDYRTEVKSLMITQEGKNSIIIPDGAKGGFVINKEKSKITKEYFTQIYSAFINALLDLVDNRKGDTIIRDDRIVAYDEDDDYFVVAADKGTASMSDVANAISIKRGFWLGDAFASGGSNGYGHKELGITAKGSLKSTERFFIEKGVDFIKDSITVVGIGSMNGDVFGNGLLASKTFKLLGAISQREIFIDPDPIPVVSFEERQRLFMAKNGSWSSYNSSLISPGGGVFLRSDKAIELTSQIQKMVGTSATVLSGEALARALLTMKVDLLFNGGVGTYVKSSDESDLDLGDKQNEAVRVDASELRCDIVCEGGNLGFTQRARIEFALHGGKINVDGIDNAAGVNISDHEVNLKILLNMIEEKGVLPPDERDKILVSLTDQVVNMVLWNNYFQSLAISRDEQLSRRYLDDFLIAIDLLTEHIDAFNRRDFFIPKNENIDNVINVKESIVRPILASLLSYSKIFIKKILIESTLIDESSALQYLYKYFPKSFVSVYENEIKHHPLRREIIATVMADTLVNL
ncbi:MAG: glutamate dehydrogenase, partial [Epsilonproteobacteria bacterium]